MRWKGVLAALWAVILLTVSSSAAVCDAHCALSCHLSASSPAKCASCCHPGGRQHTLHRLAPSACTHMLCAQPADASVPANPFNPREWAAVQPLAVFDPNAIPARSLREASPPLVPASPALRTIVLRI